MQRPPRTCSSWRTVVRPGTKNADPGDVVETHDRDVVGHGQAGVVERAHRPQGHEVVGTKTAVGRLPRISRRAAAAPLSADQSPLADGPLRSPDSLSSARQPRSRSWASNHEVDRRCARSGGVPATEVAGGEPGPELLVDGGDLHPGGRVGPRRDEDDRGGGPGEWLGHVRDRRFRRDDDDASDTLAGEVPQGVPHGGGLDAGEARDADVVPGVPRRSLDGGEDAARSGVGLPADDHPDGARASGSQGASRLVAPVPQLVHRGLDPEPGLGGDTGTCVDARGSRSGGTRLPVEPRPSGPGAGPGRPRPDRARCPPTHPSRRTPLRSGDRLLSSVVVARARERRW